MSTAAHLIAKFSKCKVNHTMHAQAKIISFDDGRSICPTHVILNANDDFIISLPIGNRISDSFFPEDEKEKLLEYFKSV